MHTIYHTTQNFDGENVDEFLAIRNHQNFTIQDFLAITVRLIQFVKIFCHMVAGCEAQFL